ncbi:MAG: hypothetical protein IK997_00015 [Bacilli bacterium]|nr:hypothetical protein [Bacilli bacterium]
MKKNVIGINYFFIHFIIEVTSFYILTSYTKSNLIWIIALLYDFLAFVPQGLFGYLKDKKVNLDFTILGLVLSTLALMLLYFKVNAIVVISIISIGNCLIHIEGAEETLRSSKGKMTPSALFVSGGSFGLITGKLLSKYNINIIYIILINLLMIVPIIVSHKNKNLINDENLEKYNFSNKKISNIKVIVLATIVVIVRAYMGYGIPTSWNKTVVETILLYCFMGVGKALGGIMIDKIGIRKTAFISTLGALPFLIFGNNLMIVSLIGIMFFSMTMAITLGLIVSVLKKYPGVAFGFTTIGLFLGSLPMFFMRIKSFYINCIIVITLTIVCVIILNKICRKENKNEHI